VRAKQKMLITGASGLLGSNLAYYFRDKYEILGLYETHEVSIDGTALEKCDLIDASEIRGVITKFSPHILIHCAGLANVDECEEDRATARETNVFATKNTVREILDKDVYLIYISTDAVYEGDKGNYSESDNINPQNYYGRTKYEGELEVSRKANSLVLRTNFFGWNVRKKKSLAEWILGELKAERKINGFEDVYFSSIYTMELAKVIDRSIEKNLTGVHNCGSSDSCSKYEFALKIAEVFGLDKTLVNPISIKAFEFKARRGKNLTLNVDKIQNALSYKLPNIGYSIEGFCQHRKSECPPTVYIP
jgi:dTDP-4-dehydrorhamnose reductase